MSSRNIPLDPVSAATAQQSALILKSSLKIGAESRQWSVYHFNKSEWKRQIHIPLSQRWWIQRRRRRQRALRGLPASPLTHQLSALGLWWCCRKRHNVHRDMSWMQTLMRIHALWMHIYADRACVLYIKAYCSQLRGCDSIGAVRMTRGDDMWAIPHRCQPVGGGGWGGGGGGVRWQEVLYYLGTVLGKKLENVINPSLPITTW